MPHGQRLPPALPMPDRPALPLVAVAGQVPPPVHGQAVMIQALLAGGSDCVSFVHAPMRYSSRLGEVGRFRVGKLAELARVVGRLWRARAGGARVLVYPPGGPGAVPIARDVVTLLATRWLFRTVVYHFHAGGLAGALGRMPRPVRAAVRWAYGRPDLSVRTSPLAPDDGRALGARRDVVVPYGIADPAPVAATRAASGPVRLLYVGALRRSKGVGVLLDAAGRLVARGLDVEVELVGGFASDGDRQRVTARAQRPDLAGRVALPGVLTGADKDAAYARADVFCFPTFFEAETFGLVLVEAMAHRLPIVATRWRGVPAVVSPAGAVLVEPRDAGALADALGPLVRDAGLRAVLGAAGRERFERAFTAERFRTRVQAEIVRAIEDGRVEDGRPVPVGRRRAATA